MAKATAEAASVFEDLVIDLTGSDSEDDSHQYPAEWPRKAVGENARLRAALHNKDCKTTVIKFEWAQKCGKPMRFEYSPATRKWTTTSTDDVSSMPLLQQLSQAADAVGKPDMSNPDLDGANPFDDQAFRDDLRSVMDTEWALAAAHMTPVSSKARLHWRRYCMQFCAHRRRAQTTRARLLFRKWGACPPRVS